MVVASSEMEEIGIGKDDEEKKEKRRGGIELIVGSMGWRLNVRWSWEGGRRRSS
jgi:hypothetical protein